MVLGYRRDAVRIWQTTREERHPVFSYDWKGPCHCWDPETKAEAKIKLDQRNDELKALWPMRKGKSY